MKLATIVNAAPTQDALRDYQNACATVNLYAYGITNTALPVLNQPPANYADFATAFAPAKAHCLQWTDGIFVKMLAMPGIIVDDAADLFHMEDSIASGYLDALIADPSNESAKAHLGQALTVMQSTVQNQLTSTENLLSSLEAFATNVTADCTTLNSIAAQALATAGADEDRIAQLNVDIEKLKNEIQSLNDMVTAAEIGIGASFFFGAIGIAVCFIPGAQFIGAGIIVVSVLGLTASIVGTVLYNEQIADKNAAMQSDRDSISQLNQDVIQLQATNKQFEWLQQANVDAQNALGAVAEMWRELDVELTNTLAELTAVGSDVTSAQYQQAKDDLAAADAHWAEVVEFATALAGFTYQWQDTTGEWHSYPQPPSNTAPTMLPEGTPPQA